MLCFSIFMTSPGKKKPSVSQFQGVEDKKEEKQQRRGNTTITADKKLNQDTNNSLYIFPKFVYLLDINTSFSCVWLSLQYHFKCIFNFKKLVQNVFSTTLSVPTNALLSLPCETNAHEPGRLKYGGRE